MNQESRKTGFPWRTALVLATLLAICGAGLWAYLKTIERAGEWAARFKTGRIERTFAEYLPEVVSTHGNVLEIATAKAPETITQTDSLSVAWETIYLGQTTSEIRVPVTYRYHIRLSDPWQLSSEGNVVSVIAPRIRASFPPAIHTDQMDKRTDEGWLRFNAQENLEALEKSLTLEFAARAGDRTHLAFVRETARESVAAFVKNWLLKEQQWGGVKYTTVVVRFADEAAGVPTPSKM